MRPIKFGFGEALTRKEDDQLIRGGGRYVADIAPAGALHATVLRSPHAHARFRITDLNAARALPGVRSVLTAADLAHLGDLPCGGIPPGVDVPVPPYPVLARDSVKHVGDAIAFVVADTVEQAKDAAEAIVIEWEALPHMVDLEAAVAPGAPRVWPDRPGNICYETTLGDKERTRAAFARAAKVVELRVVNPRVVTNYLDTRAAIAEYDAAAEKFTLTVPTQGPHLVRDVLCG